jgi:phage terminase small subunit
MPKKKLTPKMLAFCDCIALEGKNLSDAYRQSYDAENMSDAAIHTEASLLASNPAITKRIEMLRERKVRSLVCSSISDADLVLQKLR